MPVQNPTSADVAVGDATKAAVRNLVRADAIQALRAVDFGTEAEVLAITPAVGDAALATDTGIFYVCSVAATWGVLQGGGTVAVGRGHIDGLQMSAAADTLTINIAQGVCRSNDATWSIALGAGFTKTLEDVFAADTGNGMRRSADPLTAATWFYIYALADSDSVENVDIFASTNRTWEGQSAGAPSAYDKLRYVGAVYYDTPAVIIRPYTQRGDYFRWTDPVQGADEGSGTPGTFKTVTLRVPGAEDGVIAHLAVRVTSGSGATAGIVRTPGASDSLVTDAVVVPGGAAEYCSVLTNGDGQVEYTILGGWSNISITVLGWEDQRGKNSA
jgi:hypothetical protein